MPDKHGYLQGQLQGVSGIPRDLIIVIISFCSSSSGFAPDPATSCRRMMGAVWKGNRFDLI
jgi:hypothetical protein